MNNVLKCIQDKIGAEHCSRSCSRDGCDVDLDGTPSPLIVADADCEGLNDYFASKRCDFILFFQSSDSAVVIAPLELKHGRVEVKDAVEQLQAGVRFAERVMPNTLHPVCQPILFHGKGLHKTQRDKLNRAKIHFQGARLTIRTAKCCQPGNLARALPTKLQCRVRR